MGVFKIFLTALLVCISSLNANGSSLAEDSRKLATANNNLALAICEELSHGTSQNLIFSPFSLSSAFGMVYYGATGETSKELRNALGYDAAGLADDEVHESFHNYLTQSMNREDGNYDLNLANAVLVDKRMELVSDYRENVPNLYQAEIREADFQNDANKAVKEVNELVKSVTRGKIDGILEENILGPQTVMVVLNAVYFKGIWETPFDESRTSTESFYNSGVESDARPIQMMQKISNFLYTEDDDCKAVELPYKGGNISMLVLLPNQRDGLHELESKITVEKLNAIQQRLRVTQLMVKFPKFKIEYSKEVSNAFQELGAQNVFRPGAELSGISRNSAIYVNKVFHKAAFEVNEEGTKAAAVTTIIIRPVSASQHFVKSTNFIVDHPFLFTIMDKRNDMILFLGRINAL